MVRPWSILAFVLTLVLAVAGCSKPAPSVAPPGDSAATPRTAAAGDAPAGAPSAEVCMRPIDDTSTASPSRLSADATSLYVCAGSAKPEDAEPQCFAVDRATGKYRAWTPAPAPAVPVAGPSPTVETSTDAVKVCKATACSTIPVPGATDENYVVINEAGSHVALVTASEPSAIEVYDVASRKRTAHIALVGADPPCGYVRFVGDAVLVIDTVCAGPDGSGTLYTVKGKRLSRLGGDDPDSYTNADDPQIVHLDGTRWAIGLPGADRVIVVDSKTGAQLSTISLGKLEGEVTENGPMNLLVTKGGPGTLLVATGAASVGEIDLARATLSVAWTAKACPEAQAE